MTPSLSASSSTKLETPGPSYNEEGGSHLISRRYSTQESHPFATRNGVDINSDSGSPSAEYFGQIEFGRPDLKGKPRAIGSDLNLRRESHKGDVHPTSGVHLEGHPYMDPRREKSLDSGSEIPRAAFLGPPPTDLPPLPAPAFLATNNEIQGPSIGHRPMQATSEHIPRSVDLLADQSISGLSGVDTGTRPVDITSIPISAIARGQALTVETPTSAFPEHPPFRPDHIHSKTASFAASTASASRRRNRIPSREILQTALDLAQKAVEYDGANDIAAALSMYREAVSKLRSVMGRVGLELEAISPDLGIPEPTEQEKEDISAATRRRKAGTSNRSEEEGRTLKGIVSASIASFSVAFSEKDVCPDSQHDAYVARIGLLRVMADEEAVSGGSPITHSTLLQSSTSEVTTSPSTDHSGLSGIGNIMLNGFSESTSAESGTSQALHHNEIRTSTPGQAQTGTVGLGLKESATPALQTPTISPRTVSLSKYSVYGSGPYTLSPSPSSTSFNQERHPRRLSRSSRTEENENDTSYEMVSSANISLRISNTTIGTAFSTAPPPASATTFRGSNLRNFSGLPVEQQLSSSIQPEMEYRSSIEVPIVLEDGQSHLEDDADHSTRTVTLAQAPLGNVMSMETSLSDPARAPFHVLRQLRRSMKSPQGDFISQALFVPRDAWNQTGVKIPSMETKIRVMELLSQNLSTLNTAGSDLLGDPSLPSTASSTQSTIWTALDTALEDFEALSEEIRRLLTKKLGDKVNFAKPRKSNSSTISAWGSKFSKTLDKITTRRSQLERRLQRISDFFGGVILAFVLQDLSLLLSKYLKQSSKWIEE
ncbi:hypothetical protein QFC19_001885 [Naganishia cerealis]|uniref:Uncharacterized protein n=1 Tax=Naganishia cerealis TaxID=610337 RepID=A0ACC2WFI3_9TREE|nr:hypothetical protein QFC19_001885 [Naganishia cerealis]